MSRSSILVLDEGTSSTRAALYGRDLSRGAFAQSPVALHSPSPDIVEQDPAAIWRETREMALRACGGAQPAAIGLTNQRETTIVWERATGRPVHPALVWQDRRGAALGAAMKADGREADFTARTGLVADPYFSAFKLHWLFETIDGLRAAADRGDLAFGTVDSWLIWNLTGGRAHLTDASNASRTGLFDIHAQAWSPDLLDMFAVPASILPEVRDSVGDGLGETGLFGGSTPILGVLGDQQAALMGQGCGAPGQAKITFGTGAFLMAQTGPAARASQSRLLTTVAWRIGGLVSYALEGAVLNAGTAVQWLRDGLGLISASADIEALARSVPDAGGLVFVPAFTGLGAPHWAPDARGVIAGLGRGSTGAHIARAALDASALQTADIVSALAQDGAALTSLRVDGGMAANALFLQALADLTGLPVEVPSDLEMTALGAARAAAIGLGWRADPSDGADQGVARRFEPVMSPGERASRHAAWAATVRAAIAMGQTSG